VFMQFREEAGQESKAWSLNAVSEAT